jgi:hypothetical protein
VAGRNLIVASHDHLPSVPGMSPLAACIEQEKIINRNGRFLQHRGSL